jgi:transcriptional regulator with XRE-family HTH domain
MKPRSFAELYREAEQHEDYWLAGPILVFTESVVREMERQGITRTELARRLGTTPAYVTKILRGKVNFTLATMARLARVLGADLQVRLAAGSAAQGSLGAGTGNGFRVRGG